MESSWRQIRASLLTVALVGVTAGCPSRPATPCPSPTPRMQEGPHGKVPSGLVWCEGNYIEHRVEAVECVYPEGEKGSCDRDGGDCRRDSDCSAAPLGRCDGKRFGRTCECHYGCRNDAECGPGRACICDGADSKCVTAHCRTDADCEGEYLCVYHRMLACHNPRDKCRTQEDCRDAFACSECQFGEEAKAWECVDMGNTCDR